MVTVRHLPIALLALLAAVALASADTTPRATADGRPRYSRPERHPMAVLSASFREAVRLETETASEAGGEDARADRHDDPAGEAYGDWYDEPWADPYLWYWPVYTTWYPSYGWWAMYSWYDPWWTPAWGYHYRSCWYRYDCRRDCHRYGRHHPPREPRSHAVMSTRVAPRRDGAGVDRARRLEAAGRVARPRVMVPGTRSHARPTPRPAAHAPRSSGAPRAGHAPRAPRSAPHAAPSSSPRSSVRHH